MTQSLPANQVRSVAAPREARAGWSRRLRWLCQLITAYKLQSLCWRRVLLVRRFILTQTIELAVEGADVNSPVEHGRRCIYVVADLEFANQVAVVCIELINVTALVAEHDAVIDHGRRSPNRRAHQMPPD